MQAGRTPSGGRAVVAARYDGTEPNTDEIRALAGTAGYDVVERVTQRGREDGTYGLGRGKAEELADVAADFDATVVVFDGGLTPGQYGSLVELLPDGVALLDRYRLVLDVFAEGAGSRVAALQVERATLAYELPRLRQTAEESLLNRATEKGSPVLDLERRIDAIDRELDDVRDAAAERRAERRDEGFDLVALAGYTNAGKSTLLHRLADDLSVADHEPTHADLDGTAEVADRLFETLETTTRRATLRGRRTLLADTVGLVDDLPHDLVRSFSGTLGEIGDADAVLAVVDASVDPEALRRRASVAMDVVDDEAEGTVIPVLNKADRVDDEALAERRELVRELATTVHGPVAASALGGEGVDDLRAAVADSLPTERIEFVLPNDGRTQSLLSDLYERGDVEATYEGETVRVELAGRPSVVEEAKRRAEELAAPGGSGESWEQDR
ncbi:GTPase HflX [Halorarum salinum]|uniref:GTPase HflX n=1 Tax=Halorarum salinum TaxID=2743089 RepID=A0A7D5QHI2_9EURY|nr:GTPase HflX [Halobaculum salinum]QLG62244.1 GTPase HflX [Halobaculum salinum]